MTAVSGRTWLGFGIVIGMWRLQRNTPHLTCSAVLTLSGVNDGSKRLVTEFRQRFVLNASFSTPRCSMKASTAISSVAPNSAVDFAIGTGEAVIVSLPTDSVTIAGLLPAKDVSKNLQINARLVRERFRSLSR